MDYSVVTEFQKPIFENAKFPFTVHIDTLSTSYQVLTHWHSEIEILYFQSGECYAYCDQTKVHCHAGEISAIPTAFTVWSKLSQAVHISAIFSARKCFPKK